MRSLILIQSLFFVKFMLHSLRCNALIQRMMEEVSGAWGCVVNGDVYIKIDRSTNQSCFYRADDLVGSSMLTLDRSPQTHFSVTITGFLHCTVSISL